MTLIDDFQSILHDARAELAEEHGSNITDDEVLSLLFKNHHVAGMLCARTGLVLREREKEVSLDGDMSPLIQSVILDITMRGVRSVAKSKKRGVTRKQHYIPSTLLRHWKIDVGNGNIIYPVANIVIRGQKTSVGISERNFILNEYHEENLERVYMGFETVYGNLVKWVKPKRISKIVQVAYMAAFVISQMSRQADTPPKTVMEFMRSMNTTLTGFGSLYVTSVSFWEGKFDLPIGKMLVLASHGGHSVFYPVTTSLGYIISNTRLGGDDDLDRYMCRWESRHLFRATLKGSVKSYSS